MRKFFKYFFITVILVFHLFLFATVHYVFPRYDVTQVTGVEVKRMDKDGLITKTNPADGPTRDVYFINTQHPDGKVRVYRNEDTGWGFPFYFKFGSANLQAEAQALGNEQKTVQMKYYGWRITVFNEFPNALSVEALAEGESPNHPIFAYIFYVILLFTLFFSVQFVRGWFDSEN
ncbi:DUF1523 family protein [Aggregatibacter actinomycetemcomitans]|uniref:DUF1523 family protein n=1 Tax=Aggregatibacter actinomycetemcomitans TaxID=714 RepID=UPI0001B9F312|nr:DUF1523 family protein [Aggregatibacter actinomycetemcomitans]AEW76381.1 hypothetical protein ANH9381_0354 [Aggregatibacter actinomycetemcomitans ANH9381]ACX81445.1 hypothetical protein D11S_0021 [Aggregatibacter actinomycetemcomitans D11S-1]AMQ92446.1 hypothetical protein ACT74_07460 [Aggregatibacter actinomycetemcomitans]KND84457.1 hypothetical protein SCC1398_0201775 [Aggregatibacter actinomycetemcomitans serotype b str. SCC1398]KOE52452.1 hypothetical protein I23C_0309475 [Aggregatibact